MANALVNIRFIENSRGGQTLVHNDFLFRLKTRKGDYRYWYCVDKDCSAKINTKDEMVIKIKGNHNQDKTTVCAKEMLSLVRKRVRDTVDPIPSIYDDMLSTLRSREWDDSTEELATKLPTFYSASSGLYRQRSKLLPVLPKERTDITLEGKWRETTAGDDFVIADDGDASRILVFGTSENLQELAAADIWYMDGTFYSSPTYFHQVYSIHALINGFMCPLVYALLPNKQRQTYTRFFQLIQAAGDDRNILLTPTTVMMDYDVAARQAVEAVFQFNKF